MSFIVRTISVHVVSVHNTENQPNLLTFHIAKTKEMYIPCACVPITVVDIYIIEMNTLTIILKVEKIDIFFKAN